MKKINNVLVIFFLLLIANNLNAQIDESKIENLVFQGVGTRAVTMVRVLKAIENNGKFTNVKRISGVSSGSIIALLYALQYTSDEIKEIFFDLDFGSLQDKSCLLRIKKNLDIIKEKKWKIY